MKQKEIFKKTIIYLSLACLLLYPVGCNPVSGETPNTTTENKTAEAGYAFKSSDVTIHMHAEVAPILEKLGEPKSYFEAASCAFPGLEKQYTYPSFILYTYEDGETDRVASVVLLDDSVGTAEGIYINDSLEDVLAVYGEGYSHTVHLYSYESGKMKLSFIIEDNLVTSIEYVALSD